MYSIIEKPSSKSWKLFIDGFPLGNFYQTIEYGEITRMTYPQVKIAKLLALSGDGEPLGVVQGIYSEFFGFGMRLIVRNGPLTNLMSDEGFYVIEKLLMALEDFGIKNRIISAQVWWPESWGMLEVFGKLGYAPVGKFYEYMVDLDKTVEDLWRSIDRNKRKNINKALNEGVEVVEAYGHDDLITFYRMLEAAAKRHNFVADSLSFLESIWKAYKPGESSRIFFAKHDGREIAGAFTVIHGRTVYALAAGSLSEDWKVRPNDLLHWKVMEWACKQHFSKYYMGLVNDPLPTQGSKSWGIWRWKREWNGELNALLVFDKMYIPKYRYVLGAKNLVEQSIMSLKRFVGRFSPDEG